MTTFTRGTRACVGMNLAYAELFLTLAATFRRFDLELYETTIDDIRMAKDGFVAYPKPESKGVRIRVKGELD
jgi:cytochrome P450